jgi:DNA-binding PadR family transcriptional regulator
MREWTEIGFSSIYYLLRKLEKDGLIKSRREPSEGKGPGRKVYSPTLDGARACHKATIEALGVPRRCYPPIQLGMSNIDMISAAEAVSALKQYKAALKKRLDKIKDGIRKGPYHGNVEAMFRYSRTMVSAEMDWISEYVSSLEQQEK